MKLQIADVADLEVQVNKYKWQNYTEEELKSLAINSSSLKKIRPLKFDFAIFDNKDTLKYAIEYQGQQHYEPVKYFGGKDSFVKQQKYDEEKRKYCKENNIQLIEIPYWDFAKINLNYLKEKMGDLLWQD